MSGSKNSQEAPKVGRPLKFQNLEELQEIINSYFSHCEEKEKPLTTSGLAVYLDTTRKALINYENLDPRHENYQEYRNTIKRAKAKIEAFAEEKLYSNKCSTAGVIFSLKNNNDWNDGRQQIQHSGDAQNPISTEIKTAQVSKEDLKQAFKQARKDILDEV